MTLISMILALFLERLGARGKYWQMASYAQHYIRHLSGWPMVKDLIAHPLAVWLFLLLPPALVQLVYIQFDFFLFVLLINVLVVLVSIGCGYLRAQYKGYLNATERGDTEAANIYAERLGYEVSEPGGATIGQCLAWINFRYYGAVLFWFLALGPFGAVFYSLARTLEDAQQQGFIEFKGLTVNATSLKTIVFWLDWLPARIISFGYLIIGNFNQATSSWLRYVLDFNIENKKVIINTASAAEQVELSLVNCGHEAKCMVKMIKRNLLFFLAFIALLTLFGGLS